MAREPKETAAYEEELESVIRNIAMKLAEARKSKGLSQAALGKAAGMTQAQIYLLEQGAANVTIKTLLKVAIVLNVDFETLFLKPASSGAPRILKELGEFRSVLEARSSQERDFIEVVEKLLARWESSAVRSQATDHDALGIPVDDPCPTKGNGSDIK
jgi:transcriptional regulator with XRE-family HTH domain